MTRSPSARPSPTVNWRGTLSCATASRCCRKRSSRAPPRRSATWRRSPATSCSGRAAPISEMCTRRATADSRIRLRCARRLQPRPRGAGRQRPLHCHASIRHVRGDGRPRCRRSHGAGRWHHAFDSVSRVPPCSWRHAARRSGAGARRTDHPRRHSTPAGGRRSHYLKVRDRASYEFALASAAVVLDLDGDTIRAARLGLGGIATKPWRAIEAEQILTGRKATDDSVSRRSRDRIGGSGRARTQPLQDRAGEAHHRARVCHRERRERMSTATTVDVVGTARIALTAGSR